MTAPTFAHLEALPAPLLARVYVEGTEDAPTVCAVFHTGASSFFRPAHLRPALLALPSGKHLLFLPDWKDPEACAYTVPAPLLEDVRRALALSPVLSSPDVTP